jgi:hypothetical protein
MITMHGWPFHKPHNIIVYKIILKTVISSRSWGRDAVGGELKHSISILGPKHSFASEAARCLSILSRSYFASVCAQGYGVLRNRKEM